MTVQATDPPFDSAWTKLRRRKVVQWGIAYAAGAWGFLQGLAYVSTLLGWPAHLQKLAGLALLTGLPVALVLAWYHGDRGERRVTRTELAILTLLFLLGGGLFWNYRRHADEAESAGARPDGESMATLAADAGPSIAVLPFDNRSAKQDDAYFVDGIHDDILTQLQKVSALKVISRTSVEQFRDTKLPIKEIAQQLGVRSILEGGVQRGGERVRINVQLIDAGTDAHLWAETYDRELTAENIFAIQSELATAIAGALKAALTEEEKARVAAVPTQNLEAWEACQLGRQRMAKRTSAGLAEAEEFSARQLHSIRALRSRMSASAIPSICRRCTARGTEGSDLSDPQLATGAALAAVISLGFVGHPGQRASGRPACWWGRRWVCRRTARARERPEHQVGRALLLRGEPEDCGALLDRLGDLDLVDRVRVTLRRVA